MRSGRGDRERRRDIRAREVLSLVEQRLAQRHGERVREAVAEVQPCRRAGVTSVAFGEGASNAMALPEFQQRPTNQTLPSPVGVKRLSTKNYRDDRKFSTAN